MKFSENWLRSWINPDMSSTDLAHALTMAGLEVESLEPAAPQFENVVVGKVLEVKAHPDADRLNVCQVGVGAAQPLSIVCGAANVSAGVKVPCAQIGAILPGDFVTRQGQIVIKQTRVRNVESYGMLCSARELGLATESEGLWLLPADAPVGGNLRDYMELDDTLFTLKLTPNRSDCLSVAGVAREVAAITGIAYSAPRVTPAIPNLRESIKLKITKPSACPLYCARILREVNAAATTPLWMTRRLERSGIRSINAVVDITNYVMLELGQPLHAFDLSKITGGITVRNARSGEQLELLNGQNVVMQDDMLVIADEINALALAGIMGGAASGVQLPTKDVLLESAFFAPDNIAGRARRINTGSDSSQRFERGVDFAMTRPALERATQLLLEICGGKASEITQVQGQLPAREIIILRASRIKRVLGMSLSKSEIANLLKRLSFNFRQQGDNFHVTPPSYRFDISIEADLIEEIARIYGYDNILPASPLATMAMLPQSESQKPVAHFRHIMVARDYQETISYAFLDLQTEQDLCANAAPITLKNPISTQLSVMRSSLLGGLLGALRINLARKQMRVRLFEVGACFENETLVQYEKLAGLCYGAALPEQWGTEPRNVDFYDVKADVEALFAPRLLTFVALPHSASHPGRSAQIRLNGLSIGWLGELHPQWMQQYDMVQTAVWFEVSMSVLAQTSPPRAMGISKFPPVRRDLAFIIDEKLPVQILLDTMNNEQVHFVTEIALFDMYRGKGIEEGKKSLAFRVLLQDTEKTLTDFEIEASMRRLTDALHKLGAQLRT
ncbi:MAG: phenylalanine--tRNA ligase subunit beta [Candidatus Nitrotoga sp.]